jgi:hypothetical protein
MKKLTLSLLISLGFVGAAFAGQPMVSSKEYKQPAPEEYCFNDREFQIDIFGAYMDGNGHTHAGPIREAGYGGGIGVNYFFSRHIGIGVDATWIYDHENGAANHDGHHNDDDETTFHNITSSLIFRFPIDSACIAPYVFAGGGFHVDGDQWASAHAGVGIEYRIVPQRIGLFTDARFTYYGTRYGRDDQNNVMARAGIRFVF